LDLAKKLEQSSLEATKPFYFIDSCSAIAELVESLVDLGGNTLSLYIDLEGVNLSRQGTISILQLLNLPQKRTYLIDVHTLGSNAFSTAGANGQTLKLIFESETIPKAFFDVRNDSDALYYHFGISLAGIHDIQVMEFAARRVKGRFVSGLSKCIERDLVLTFAERQIWQATKERGLNLFTPERGGSYELLNARPLSDELFLYCVQDVQYLPRLWSGYSSKLTPNLLARVKMVAADRVKSSQSEAYNGHGRHKAIGPW
jgi:exonuclease 3'-5' domain-containing protein 1